MAIVHGNWLKRSRKLAAIALADDRAVAEYTYMLPQLRDDWGRFLADPRAIAGDVYRYRRSVAEADIERWLMLFATPLTDLWKSCGKAVDAIVENGEGPNNVGLLRFYDVDGERYAEWTNYGGDPESTQKHHNCPEPPWSTHRHSKRCKLWGKARRPKPGRRSGPQSGLRGNLIKGPTSLHNGPFGPTVLTDTPQEGPPSFDVPEGIGSHAPTPTPPADAGGDSSRPSPHDKPGPHDKSTLGRLIDDCRLYSHDVDRALINLLERLIAGGVDPAELAITIAAKSERALFARLRTIRRKREAHAPPAVDHHHDHASAKKRSRHA